MLLATVAYANGYLKSPSPRKVPASIIKRLRQALPEEKLARMSLQALRGLSQEKKSDNRLGYFPCGGIPPSASNVRHVQPGESIEVVWETTARTVAICYVNLQCRNSTLDAPLWSGKCGERVGDGSEMVHLPKTMPVTAFGECWLQWKMEVKTETSETFLGCADIIVRNPPSGSCGESHSHSSTTGLSGTDCSVAATITETIHDFNFTTVMVTPPPMTVTVEETINDIETIVPTPSTITLEHEQTEIIYLTPTPIPIFITDTITVTDEQAVTILIPTTLTVTDEQDITATPTTITILSPIPTPIPTTVIVTATITDHNTDVITTTETFVPSVITRSTVTTRTSVTMIPSTITEVITISDVITLPDNGARPNNGTSAEIASTITIELFEFD